MDIKIKGFFTKLSKKYTMQRMWWLGFLGLMGVPALVEYLLDESYRADTFLTFLFFLYFIPVKRKKESFVTSEEIEYYKKHPEKIETIKMESKIRYKYLINIFLLGLVMVVVSKIVPIFYFFIDEFILKVFSDMLFEIGVAIWWGTITAYIIEVHAMKEDKECRKKQEELREILRIENK